MMRVGLAVTRTTVRAIAVRSGKAPWIKEAEYDKPDQLANAVRETLSAAPIPALRRRSVCLAVAPSLSQARRIHGLPATTDARVLERLVSASITRFFVKPSHSVLVTGVRVVEPGSVWAGIVDEATVRAVAAGCRAARFRLDRVVPAAVAIGAAIEDDLFCWIGDDIHLHLRYSKAELVSVHRGESSSDCATATPIESLLHAGDSKDFVAAYGAAVLTKSFPISLNAGRISRPRSSSRWRIGIAASAALATLVLALLAPLYVTLRAGRKAEQVVADLAKEMQLANEINGDVANFTNALNAVSRFAAGKRSGILLLEQFASAVPERTAIVALRVDTAGGTVVVVGPHAANVPSALGEIPLFTDAQITGPITTEVIAGEQVERVAVRFRFADRGTFARTAGGRRAD